MMKRILVAAVGAVLLVSCGAASTIETTSTSATTTPPSTTSTSNSATASTSTSTASPGKPAPDFTLTLSDGTDFTLSSETRPVYMVFWAEW
ncbi:MAG: hypothetical protein WAM81_12400 [Acidimicrobiia bacterium]